MTCRGRPRQEVTSNSEYGRSGPRVVHVVARYPPGLGGVENVAQCLARTQSKLGVDVSVLTSDHGTKGRGRQTESFLVKRLRSVSVFRTPVIPSLLLRLCALDKTSIIHLHISRAYTPEMVWFYSRFTGRRYIAHFHGPPVASGRAGFLLRAYMPFVLGPVLRSAAAVVALTESERSTVAATFKVDPAKIRVIRNGVDRSFWRCASRSIHERPRLLFVGRFVAQKNVHLLLRALDGVSEQFDTTLVGEGELEADLRSAVADLALQNVRFHGAADGLDLRALYQDADFLVLPSAWEGMPLVLLEAMAMGLPIVATDIPGIREIVGPGQNGVLVPAGNPPALRKALLAVASDADRYLQMSEASCRLAAHYSWEAVSEEFQQVYARA
jgi:glycosyltransferase involved in cell wall biosynthesis